jgi:BolA protein
MSVKERMEGKLAAALAPTLLEVIDESHKHAGHIGHPGSGHPGAMSSTETHYHIKVVSDAFTGKTRLARHRLVNEILAEDLRSGVHALGLEARAPGE